MHGPVNVKFVRTASFPGEKGR